MSFNYNSAGPNTEITQKCTFVKYYEVTYNNKSKYYEVTYNNKSKLEISSASQNLPN